VLTLSNPCKRHVQRFHWQSKDGFAIDALPHKILLKHIPTSLLDADYKRKDRWNTWTTTLFYWIMSSALQRKTRSDLWGIKLFYEYVYCNHWTCIRAHFGWQKVGATKVELLLIQWFGPVNQWIGKQSIGFETKIRWRLIETLESEYLWHSGGRCFRESEETTKRGETVGLQNFAGQDSEGQLKDRKDHQRTRLEIGMQPLQHIIDAVALKTSERIGQRGNGKG
jgi:hypothetical protein